MIFQIHCALFGQWQACHATPSKPLFDPAAPEFHMPESMPEFHVPEGMQEVQESMKLKAAEKLEANAVEVPEAEEEKEEAVSPETRIETQKEEAEPIMETKHAKTPNADAAIEFLWSDGARKDSRPKKYSFKLLPSVPTAPSLEKQVQSTDEVPSEDAFLKSWEALGTNKDADRIKVMLNEIRQWRQVIPGRSRKPKKHLQEWWQSLLRCWQNEADCDRAIAEALRFLNQV